jgi:hypothetical protein
MMTNGPAARIGDILEVPFARPRDRHAVLEHPDYDRLRQHLISFLEDHAHPPKPTEEATTDAQSVPPREPGDRESFSGRRTPSVTPKSHDAA